MTWNTKGPPLWTLGVLLAACTLLSLGALGVGAWNAHKAAKTQVAVARGETTVAKGGAAAAGEAVGIADAGRQRDEHTVIIQRENAHDLQTAPGADAPVDPELLRRLARGMCRYASASSDPRCVELRQADPALVP